MKTTMMTHCHVQLGQRLDHDFDVVANSVSAHAAANRPALWHFETAPAITTVGTGFKPYGQRPKEHLP